MLLSTVSDGLRPHYPTLTLNHPPSAPLSPTSIRCRLPHLLLLCPVLLIALTSSSAVTSNQFVLSPASIRILRAARFTTSTEAVSPTCTATPSPSPADPRCIDLAASTLQREEET